MKKIEYQAPEMEVVKVEVLNPLLNVSTGESSGGTGEGFGDDVQPG